MAKANIRSLDGENVLYRLFLEVLELPDEVTGPVLDVVVGSTAVWFSPEVYANLPVLLPWVVRDPKCRPRKVNGVTTPDEWAAPHDSGYLRDDNSLVKGIPRRLQIRGPRRSFMAGGRLGNSFVASHVWREVNLDSLASRDPRLNTFVPNLVWLPTQVSKLSDLEGGKVQEALKRVSWSLFRHAPVTSVLQDKVEAIWSLLPEPSLSTTLSPADLNYFVETTRFFESRQAPLAQVLRLCRAMLAGTDRPPKGRIPTRYYEQLPQLPAHVIARLERELAEYETP